jgi:hypothetical protein
MSKIKTGSFIGKTDLRFQMSRGKEIAPLYAGNTHPPYAVRVQLATAQAWAAGYLTVAISNPSGLKSVYIFDGIWQPADWSTGKWGHPKYGLHFTPLPQLMPASITQPRPLQLLLPARVGA